jgi:hypothetical protein
MFFCFQCAGAYSQDPIEDQQKLECGLFGTTYELVAHTMENGTPYSEKATTCFPIWQTCFYFPVWRRSVPAP